MLTNAEGNSGTDHLVERFCMEESSKINSSRHGEKKKDSR